jgi:nucleotidyltransferase substrate binding protein (TIGR01987 family)
MSNDGKDQDLLRMFEKAVGRLCDALKQEKTEYLRDSAIQRFEFTYELAWKTLKAHMEMQGLQVYSPRDSMRAAFQLGVIEDDPLWLETILLRNRTTHTYNEEVAEEIYAALPGVLALYQGLLSKLKRIP